MQVTQWKKYCLMAVSLIAAAFMGGCSGDDGSNGNNALETNGITNAKTLTTDDLKNIALDGTVLSASISNNQPVVKFQVLNKYTRKGITGLKTFSLHVAQLKPESNGSNSYWMNYIADGLPLSAMPAATATPRNPATDAVTTYNADGTVKAQGYSVVDHGDGTYTVTFGANIKANTKVVYDGSLTHRIVVGVRSVVAPGVVGKTADAYAGPINPATGAVMTQFLNTNGTALVYDFVPATGRMLTDSSGNQAFARDIVTIAACNQCHYRIEYGSNNTSGHFGSRPDTKVCVVCHTPQLNAIAEYGEGDFTSFIHKIHMGEELPAEETAPLTEELGVNEIKYPQDVRNCAFCHKGVDVNNWMTKPSRKACGSCHNDVNFATGAGHVTQADDSLCINCHATGSVEPVSSAHLPIVPPAADNAVALSTASKNANSNQGNSNTNASYVAGSSLSRLPVGAKQFSWVIKSVSRNSSKQPVMEFKFQVATAGSDGVLGTPVDVVFNDSTTATELVTGFVGSPSIYWAFAVPQDGISAPVDYNATVSAYLKRVWNGTVTNYSGPAAAATLTGPSGGYYTITMTGVTIPDTAVMLTGGIGYTYGLGTWKASSSYAGTSPWTPFCTTTQPFTQTDLVAYPYDTASYPDAGGLGVGGLAVPADNQWKVATGYTGRRVITDNAKCNACHGRLGVKPTYHAGQRNDTRTCTFCHTVNRTNSGWAVNIKDDVHAIHAAAKRSNKFSWEVSAGAMYWEVTYPGTGMLKNCEMCHVAGFYDFSNSVYTSTYLDKMLYTTAASGTMPATISVITTGSETVPGTYYSPFVTAGAAYGSTFSFSAATGVTTAAADTTLVISPITSACFSCHDTTAAMAHMRQFGGSIYAARSTALASKETCLVCHAALSTTNSTNTTTPAIKAVHRWW